MIREQPQSTRTDTLLPSRRPADIGFRIDGRRHALEGAVMVLRRGGEGAERLGRAGRAGEAEALVLLAGPISLQCAAFRRWGRLLSNLAQGDILARSEERHVGKESVRTCTSRC